MQDRKYRDLFVGQIEHRKVQYKFNNYSVKEPWSKAWKTECKKRIKKCEGFLIIVTKNTESSLGALWEVECAKKLKIPIRLIYANKKNRPKKLPKQLRGIEILNWERDKISNFIDTL